MARITVEEGLDKVMSVVLNPDADPEKIRAAVRNALQSTENNGFGAGVRWQLKSLALLDDKYRDRIINKYEKAAKEGGYWKL